MTQELGKRYAQFAQLPLLQGVNSGQLLQWEEALPLRTDRLPASPVPVIRQGDSCSRLLWLVEGELLREHRSQDGTYATRSCLKAPAVIEADRLFGLTPTYQHTYRAKTEVRMLGVGKGVLGTHLMKSEVFRLNMLNMLCACAQKRSAKLLPSRLDGAEARLRHFLRILFRDCQGEVELTIQMKDLARYIGETRLSVSRILSRWVRSNRILPGRGHFTILDIADI